MPSNPRIISLDIETYGALKHEPPQRVFHPTRSMAQDHIHPSRQIHAVSITIPTLDPRLPIATRSTGANAFFPSTSAPWSISTLSALQPGKTFCLDPAVPSQFKILMAWLKYADTIIGMNIAYDLLYLRSSYSKLRPILDSTTHFLLDLQVIAYHESEVRPEKSLKDIGIVLGTHRYDQTASDQFETPAQSRLYCGEDTHNTLLPISVLCTRIRDKYPNSDKLSPWALRFYSDAIWECVRQSENGVGYSYPLLLNLANRTHKRIQRIETILLTRFNIQIQGTGCRINQAEFLAKLLAVPVGDTTLGELAAQEPTLARTKKKKEISLSTVNRNLFAILLPTKHPYQTALRLWSQHAKKHKIYSTYCHSLLWHQSNKPNVVSSALIPYNSSYQLPEPRVHIPIRQPISRSRVGIAYPTWYIVPSFAKDGAGASGGTKQIRSTCKGPAIQTQPKAITRCITSRFKGTGRIVSYDLSQAEMRTAALLSGDPSLVNAYTKGEDLHAALAIHCEGPAIVDSPFFHTGSNIHDARQHYKQANFLILFRGAEQTLATTLLNKCGVIRSLPWCHSVIHGLRTLRKGLWAWQDSLIHEAHHQGYLSLPFIGVSRIFAGGNKFDENEIVNLPVQAFASLTFQRFETLISKRLGPASRLSNSPILPMVNIYDSCKFDVQTDAHERELDDILTDAHQELVTTDIWGMLQERYGNEVPLLYDKE